MKRISLLLIIMMAGVVAAWAQAPTSAESKPATQSAKEVRGASPYVEIKDEPSPKLIVDPPLPEGLAIGVVWIQYRVENLRIVPVFGEGAAKYHPGSDICTLLLTTCPGGGRTLAIAIPSTSLGCRSASTRCGSSWSMLTTKSSPDRPRYLRSLCQWRWRTDIKQQVR